MKCECGKEATHFTEFRIGDWVDIECMGFCDECYSIILKNIEKFDEREQKEMDEMNITFYQNEITQAQEYDDEI